MNREAKAMQVWYALRKEYGDTVSVGVGDDTLYVYFEREPKGDLRVFFEDIAPFNRVKLEILGKVLPL